MEGSVFKDTTLFSYHKKFKTMEIKIYHFEDWLIWLNENQIPISIEHMYFKEHYQNLETFETNYHNFNNLNK